MTYVVSYDIGDDTLRTKVAKVLEGFGIRVQESVFECRLDPVALDALTARLESLLRGKHNGNVRLYRVCADCIATSFGLGEVVPSGGGEACVIV